tara:strand:- start:177 stop:437 length:261 start_codon:yes stop_codon:yes gene_type:complete
MTNQQNQMLREFALSSINQTLADIKEAKQRLKYAQNEMNEIDENEAPVKFEFNKNRVMANTKLIQDLEAKIQFIKSQYTQMTGLSL